MRYLTPEELVAINQEAVAVSSDPHGVMNQANLTHLIQAVQYKYETGGEPALAKAAFILEYLAFKGHVFIEGNKRTAETATILFLRLNGHYFREEDQDALTEFILQTAQGKQSLTSIKKWLKERIKTI